ncbi:MAG: HAD hydrolase-like protein [Phycisphaerales bacterium]|nr:HAD hydrolase-like protein [Phycisphaerales bacterium]
MLILFDIDMTLVKSNHIGVTCLRDAGRELFDPGFTVEGIVFGGGIDPVIVADMLVLNRIEPTETNVRAMRSTYHRFLSTLAESQSVATALPGAHELVDATRNHVSKPAIGLLTGNYQETGTIKVVSAGFDPSLFTINAWGDCSPHPQPKRAHLPPVAIERYQRVKNTTLDPQSVIIIGDTIHDVSCAKVNGCRSLAVATGHDDAATLRDAGADLVVDDLTKTGKLIEWMMHK